MNSAISFKTYTKQLPFSINYVELPLSGEQPLARNVVHMLQSSLCQLVLKLCRYEAL